MHVLIVPSWYPTERQPIGGSFFQAQAQALAKHGIKVTVAYPEIRSLKEWRTAGQVGRTKTDQDGVTTYRSIAYRWRLWKQQPPRELYRRELERLYDQIEAEEGVPDLIHAHASFWGGWAAGMLANIHQLPFVLTEHASSVGQQRLTSEQANVLPAIVEQANAVLAVGGGLAATIKETTGRSPVVVPNIVDTEQFNITQSRQQQNEPFQFFSCALLTKGKGMHELLTAFASAHKNSAARLVIGGDGPEKASLIKLAQSLQIDEQVTFLGMLSRSDVIRSMQACDAFVLASHYETFGVVYIEAMACGKPVIATACGGPDAFVTKDNGLQVPVGDVAALSNALRKLASTIDTYSPQRIREGCIARFSERAVVSQLVDIYEPIIDTKRRQRSG
ncbi:glycosyltransferase [Aureibacillus halotolerans]|uniref:Glycosyltransferase involved in cell wall biosynthesis n=1 Tax=Aureibacillus halotolerans TaxID=1508390 RepID=A0A4R6TYL6_9BACI|nr:glycosyltransferase [Aureibacillus halotolerans]TDQ38681.1 glycosyltransferase involved in cell wall biosynthesis [Aureibacillus halotolerans]